MTPPPFPNKRTFNYGVDLIKVNDFVIVLISNSRKKLYNTSECLVNSDFNNV